MTPRVAGTMPAPGRLGLFLPPDAGRDALVAALAGAGWDCTLLPAPVTALRPWLDQPLDALVIAPFGGWEEPATVIALARAVAGARPILALTANPDVGERLIALQAGADDALHGDSDYREIAARLAGLVRRQRLANGWLECAEVQIDLIQRRVMRRGTLVPMPLREFDLLTNLARVPNHFVPRATLLKAVWHIDFDPGTNRVEVHMSRLRAKLDRGFAWPMLVTARGRGYALRSAPGIAALAPCGLA